MLHQIMSLLPNCFLFFTTWALIAHLLYYNKIVQANTFLLAFLVSIGGLLLTYVYPKYILIPYYHTGVALEISGISLILLDFVFHQVPFLLFLYSKQFSNLKLEDVVYCMVVILLYVLAVHDPLTIYRLCVPV